MVVVEFKPYYIYQIFFFGANLLYKLVCHSLILTLKGVTLFMYIVLNLNSLTQTRLLYQRMSICYDTDFFLYLSGNLFICCSVVRLFPYLAIPSLLWTARPYFVSSILTKNISLVKN